VHVVDDAQERLLLGDLREQGQRGESDEEPIRGGALTRSEDRREGVALRHGESLDVPEHRAAQLMQAAVGELHLRLDAGGTGHVPPLSPGHDVLEEGGLADARLATEHDGPAATVECIGHQLIECLAFGLTPEKGHRWPASPLTRAFQTTLQSCAGRTTVTSSQAWPVGSPGRVPGATNRVSRHGGAIEAMRVG
jgi:hypothetical protein